MAVISTIGIVGYESCSEQDTITPLEIFKGTSMVLGRQLNPLGVAGEAVGLDVKLVALKPGTITMQMGTEISPDSVLDDTVLYDLLYVPGGVGTGPLSEDPLMLDTIRRHHQAGKIVASNCSGVGVLFRAGVLGDSPVTCAPAIARGLTQDGANVPQPRRMWIGNPEARLWTASGSYGVNGACVALVAHYFGRDTALAVAMMFDTFGGIGDAIFDLEGPAFSVHPDLELKFQDFFQPMLLPEPKVGAAA